MTQSETLTVLGHTFEFTRINNDVNGNPRYLVHFLDLGLNKYASTKETKSVGLSKFTGNSFGGGFVFQSYNIWDSAKKFVEVGLHRK